MPETPTRRSRRYVRAGIALAMCAGLFGVGTAGAQSEPTTVSAGIGYTGGVFVPTSPARLLDTRDGTGGWYGAIGSYELPIHGNNGIPTDATAVVLNVTVTEGTATSYITVQPGGGDTHLVSSLNFEPGQTIANGVTTKIGSNGKVWIANAAGSAHVVVDLAGYYVPGEGAPGPMGPQGVQGPAGPQGLQGVPGIAGAQGDENPYLTSANTVNATTIAGGLQGNIGLLPLSGHVDIAPVMTSGGTLDPSSEAETRGIPQVINQDMTITTINTYFETIDAMSLVGTTITPSAQLWAIPSGQHDATPIAGAMCVGSPAFTSVLASGTQSQCELTGLSIPVTEGTRLFVTIGATATGIGLVNNVPMVASVSVS